MYAVLLRKQRMSFALEQADVGVVADDHVKSPSADDLLEEPHVARVEPVVAAGDDHPSCAGGRRSRHRVGSSGKPGQVLRCASTR